jgi:hypothetical protein
LIICLTYEESESEVVADDTLDGRKTATGFSTVHTRGLSKEAVQKKKKTKEHISSTHILIYDYCRIVVSSAKWDSYQRVTHSREKLETYIKMAFSDSSCFVVSKRSFNNYPASIYN